MNVKKILLLALLATAVSTKVFAGFAIGVKGGVDINTSAAWRIGPSIGLGNMMGSPFFIDVLMAGNDYSFSIQPSFDWHLLTWNIAIIQLYMGLGVGTKLTFSTSDNSRNPFDFIVAGRIPIGVKLFLSTLELFVETSPQFGWQNYSYTNTSNNKDRISNNSFYWALGLDLGLRIWW